MFHEFQMFRKPGEGMQNQPYEIRKAGQFEEHGATVWRVCWNITGTIMASSGDDGYVRVCD